MGSIFNPQILVEKLAKLNNSQASIETLSHWCIFHMNKARQVVETWDRQFHCSPRDQRLAFLYLANDILQNSRRKGSEFVAEFWKVLPDALRYVIDHGDEFGRNAAMRLITIWEERKVFGSRGQMLKEELMGRHMEKSIGNGKQVVAKSKISGGNTVDKLVSGYQVVKAQGDEEMILTKCRGAINFVEKVEKEIGSNINAGQFHGSTLVEELQGQHSVLQDCVEQLTSFESSRASLVSLLREALHEQEFKLDQVRNQLQTAQSQSEQANSICRQVLGEHEKVMPKEVHAHKEQSAPVMYAPAPAAAEEDPRKSAAAAMAAKLTASTSSAQMLSYVLSSLASEGVIGNPTKDSSSGEYLPPEKRQKLDQSAATAVEPPPPPSSSPPPLPPLPPMPQHNYPGLAHGFVAAGSASYSYGAPPLPVMPSYSQLNGGVSPYTAAPPPTSYQPFQAPDGTFYNHPSSMPISRQ